jgi:hypothetical protein
MAINVYLTFFHRYSASQLRSLEWKYLTLCYGIPFIPAIIFVFMTTPERGHIYGSAVVSPPLYLFLPFYSPIFGITVS